MQWPVLPTQPAGDQPGPLLPAPVPVAGIEVPSEIGALLGEREVPVWVGRPVGEPAERGLQRDNGDRWLGGVFLALIGALLQLPFAVGYLVPMFPFAGGCLLMVSGLLLVGVPLRRAARRRRRWYVLTTERVGAVEIDGRARGQWLSAAELGPVEVIRPRKDGSGTIFAEHRPDRYGMAPEPLVIGRIPDARNVADLIGLLGLDQR